VCESVCVCLSEVCVYVSARSVCLCVCVETSALLDENRQLRDARTCRVCMDACVSVVFLPCGHLVCCERCTPALRNCAVCRALIRGTVRVFLN